MNTFRPEPHVAQQSRRDKLRSCSSLYDTPPPASMFSTSGDLDFAGAPAGEASFHEGVGWAMNSQIHHSPLLVPPNIYHIKHPGVSNYHEVLPHFQTSTSQLYLHDVVNAPSTTNQALDAAGLPSWVDTSNELLLLPSYANPGASSSVWLNRQPNEWYGDHDNFARIKPEGGFAAAGGTSQGLSLSLSSNPVPELQTSSHFDEDVAGNVIGFSSPYPKFSAVGSPQGIAAAAPDPRRGAGPLGPFTGYAAILKNSKFLRPAQQLLDEFCSIASGSKLARGSDGSGRSSGAGESGGSNGRAGNSGVSSSSFYSSTEVAGDGGGSSGACHSQQPEFQHKKAKLLYMQEEVCRRYKQYHQQMQMVVSSFESVAGLSAATPYISLALKAISKHFRCLKNAITDQLRHVSKLLGEEFMSSPGSSKGETTPRLKYVDPSIRKQKAASENSLSFLDQCQPVWRPQRGLPERAVAVLRAWLFDHFLHPYPTDTDKHMLASQTGLSRNQVSNWFINARVRLWKPMVEEIHMLETKGMSGMDLNSTNRNEGKQAPAPASDQLSEAQSNKLIDCSQLDPMLDEGSSRAMEQWHREKRSRMEECGIPTGIDGSLMSFAVYPGPMDVGGLGAVSLTLGLQHNEGAQQQQQQIRRHFGSHMVHDFVG